MASVDSETDIFLSSALSALRTGDLKEAERLFGLVLKQDPQNQAAIGGTFRARLLGKELEGLEEVLEPLEDGPLRGFLIADLHGAQGKDSEALSSYEQVLTRLSDADHPEWDLLGELGVLSEDGPANVIMDRIFSRSEKTLKEDDIGPFVDSLAAVVPHLDAPLVAEVRKRASLQVLRILERERVLETVKPYLNTLNDSDEEVISSLADERFSALLDAKQFDNALAYIKVFGTLKKERFIDAVHKEAAVLQEYGSLFEALILYEMLGEQFEEQRKTSGEQIFELGKLMADKGKHAPAFDMYVRAREYSGHDIEKEADDIAQSLIKIGEYDEALRMAKLIKGWYPDYKLEHRIKTIANMLKEEGRIEEAQRCYQELSNLDEKFDLTHSLVLVGESMRENNDPKGAIKYFIQAQEAGDPYGYMGLAGAYEDLKWHKEVEETYEEAMEAFKDDVRIMRRYAEYLMRRKRVKKPAGLVEKVRRLSPDDKWAKIEQQNLLIKQIDLAEKKKEYEKAFYLYTKYLRIKPKTEWAEDRRLLVLLALRGRDKKAWKKAVALLKKRGEKWK